MTPQNWTNFGVWVRNFTQIACVAFQEWAIKYFTFCHVFLPVTIQSIITCMGIFHVLNNGFRHFIAHRIIFHLVYLMALFDDVHNYPCLLIFDDLSKSAE